jgi:hypothetical protein
MERKIRRLKRFAEGTLDPDTAREYGRKLKAAQRELREFIAKTNADEGKIVLRRDYSREKNYGGLTDKEKDDIIIKEIHECGLVGKIHLDPIKIDVDSLGYDSEHFDEKERGITFDEAKSFINNARFSITRWNGDFENYFSNDGASYVNCQSNIIRTSYKKIDFTESVKKALEVLDKYGR